MQKQKQKTLPATIIRLAFGAGGILTLLAFLFSIAPSNNATANSTDKGNAISKYPFISGTRLDACSLCHTNSIPALNAYGSAYLSHGRNLNAFGQIENLDSDGDGFTNIQEINALFFPGDANDHPPSVTATPTRTSTSVPPTPTRTNTSIPPTPTRTNTSVPPTPTRTNTSVTPTPTRTSTSVPPTPTQTSTSVPPIPTQTNTSIPATPTQANTSAPPTATPVNTVIPPTPTSMNTSLPPTETPTVLPPTSTPGSTMIPPTSTSTSLPPTATPTDGLPTATFPTQTPVPSEPPPTPTEPPPTPTATPSPRDIPNDLELDIRSVSITPHLWLGPDKSVTIHVQIIRLSKVGGAGTVIISGTQDGEKIYLQTQVVEIDEKGESRWYSFPSYRPTHAGTIHWKVHVIDGRPDADTRTVVTRVNRHR
jgi:hypothetical protein